jgi:hypothetical protein
MITRSQAQFEARVPTHAQNDDLSVEVPSFEQIFDRDEPLHLFIIVCHPVVCTRAGWHTHTAMVAENGISVCTAKGLRISSNCREQDESQTRVRPTDSFR